MSSPEWFARPELWVGEWSRAHDGAEVHCLIRGAEWMLSCDDLYHRTHARIGYEASLT
jgi:hypothetical protein